MDPSLVRVILSLNEQVGFCREHSVLTQTHATVYSLTLSVPDQMYYLYKKISVWKQLKCCSNSLETVRKLSLLEKAKGMVISGQAQLEFSFL